MLSLLLSFLPLIAQVSAEERREGFVPLFPKDSLEDWTGDPKLWSISGGVLTGSTDGVTIERNTFLASRREYGDFILRVQVRLRNGNSGIQFRSESLPDHVARGLQADMAEGNWLGSIYDERGTRGVIVNGWKGKAEKVVKAGDWNEVEVFCRGDQIRITVNGLVTAELQDSSRLKGILAFQLHRGPQMKAEFRSMRIKTL